MPTQSFLPVVHHSCTLYLSQSHQHASIHISNSRVVALSVSITSRMQLVSKLRPAHTLTGLSGACQGTHLQRSWRRETGSRPMCRGLPTGSPTTAQSWTSPRRIRREVSIRMAPAQRSRPHAWMPPSSASSSSTVWPCRLAQSTLQQSALCPAQGGGIACLMLLKLLPCASYQEGRACRKCSRYQHGRSRPR